MSHVGPTVENVKALMTVITGAFPTHMRRQAYEIAHRLARTALFGGSLCSWFEEPPDLITDLLLEECIGLFGCCLCLLLHCFHILACSFKE